MLLLLLPSVVLPSVIAACVPTILRACSEPFPLHGLASVAGPPRSELVDPDEADFAGGLNGWLFVEQQPTTSIARQLWSDEASFNHSLDQMELAIAPLLPPRTSEEASVQTAEENTGFMLVRSEVISSPPPVASFFIPFVLFYSLAARLFF